MYLERSGPGRSGKVIAGCDFVGGTLPEFNHTVDSALQSGPENVKDPFRPLQNPPPSCLSLALGRFGAGAFELIRKGVREGLCPVLTKTRTLTLDPTCHGCSRGRCAKFKEKPAPFPVLPLPLFG